MKCVPNGNQFYSGDVVMQCKNVRLSWPREGEQNCDLWYPQRSSSGSSVHKLERELKMSSRGLLVQNFTIGGEKRQKAEITTLFQLFCLFFSLSGPTLRTPPPHRAIGYSYTYRTYVFRVSRGIALYPSPQFALSQPRRGGGRGYRSSSGPLQGIALYGGIAEIVSPIAV